MTLAHARARFVYWRENLSTDVFEPRTSTGSWICPSLERFDAIAFVMSNRKHKNKSFAVHGKEQNHAKKENIRLPVAVRGSKTSVLKFPIILREDAKLITLMQLRFDLRERFLIGFIPSPDGCTIFLTIANMRSGSLRFTCPGMLQTSCLLSSSSSFSTWFSSSPSSLDPLVSSPESNSTSSSLSRSPYI